MPPKRGPQSHQRNFDCESQSSVIKRAFDHAPAPTMCVHAAAAACQKDRVSAWHDALSCKKHHSWHSGFKYVCRIAVYFLSTIKDIRLNALAAQHLQHTLILYMTHAHNCDTSYFTLLRTCCSHLFKKHFKTQLLSCQKGSTMMSSVPAFMSNSSSCC